MLFSQPGRTQERVVFMFSMAIFLFLSNLNWSAKPAISNPEPPAGTGEVWKKVEELTSKGKAALDCGKYEEAIQLFSQAIAKHSRAGEALIGRGMAHAALENFGAAKRDFSKVLELNPRSPMALGELALVRRRLGDLDGALSDMKQVLTILPDNTWAWINLAEIHMDRGELGPARQALEKAAGIDPSYSGLSEAKARLAVASPADSDQPPPVPPKPQEPSPPSTPHVNEPDVTVSPPDPIPLPPSTAPATTSVSLSPDGPVLTSEATVFADDFQRADDDAPGPLWLEFGESGDTLSATDTSWGIRGGSLRGVIEPGSGPPIGIFVVSVASFPATALRVSFRMRPLPEARAGLGIFYCWLIPPPDRYRADNDAERFGFHWEFRQSLPGPNQIAFPVGAAVPLRGQSLKPSQGREFEEWRFEIREGSFHFSGPGSQVQSEPLARDPRPAERWHLLLGVRAFRAETPVGFEIRDLQVTTVP